MTMINTTSLSCGSCTLCCKLLAIEEIEKPIGEWCKHCNVGVGCSAYEDRPNACREFECLWLHSQKPEIDDTLRFPLEMRPDKSKVILFKKKDGTLTAVVPPERPDSWKQGQIGQWLKRENQVRQAYILCGDKTYVMPKD